MRKRTKRILICIVGMFLLVPMLLYALEYFVNVQKLETSLKNLDTDTKSIISRLDESDDTVLTEHHRNNGDLWYDVSIDNLSGHLYIFALHDIDKAEIVFRREHQSDAYITLFEKDVSSAQHKLQYSYVIMPDMLHLTIHRYYIVQVDDYIIKYRTPKFTIYNSFREVIKHIE